MPGMLTLKELQQAVSAGEIDTVVACFPDMQGRLIGKRFQAEFFLGGAHDQRVVGVRGDHQATGPHFVGSNVTTMTVPRINSVNPST